MGQNSSSQPGKVQGSSRPLWWKNVTIAIGRGKAYYDQVAGKPIERISVELILPNGNKKPVGSFSEETPLSDIRHAAGEVFKGAWDPLKRCEK
jgi:hypothetical protein